MNKHYVVVMWPDVQSLQDLDGFDSHAYLINDDKGIDDFGSSAYFVEEEWYNKNT